MRVYISGPISGTDDFIQRFAEAERSLKEAGYTDIFNPTDAERFKAQPPGSTTWEEYMGEDLRELVLCDTVYFLKGWQHSKGATLEHKVAEHLGLQMLWEV